MPDHSLPTATTPWRRTAAWRLAGPRNPLRLALVLAVGALALLTGATGAMVRTVLADAYLGVAVFVAATLALAYGAERAFNLDFGRALEGRKALQVPVAALLGMLPGCAGAVMVTASYAAGHVGMGAMVATLTATMGDAAFLLLATRPEVAAVLLPLSLLAGIATGYLTDALHLGAGARRGDGAAGCRTAPRIGARRWRDQAFGVLAVPGLLLGLLAALRIDLPHWAETEMHGFALVGIGLTLAIWATSPMRALSNPEDAPLTRVTEETAFIGFWVVAAFLGYGLLETAAGVDLAALFGGFAVFMPLVGTLIGFLPGCGPQVVVVTLYLNGLVPFSALAANALSNDGDALFPAIALAPRAAIQATLLSAIPALLLGYGFHFFAPGFMN